MARTVPAKGLRPALVALVTGLLLLSGTPWAAAAPGTDPVPRPTVDLTAPTPTSPPAGPPPRGSAPDGSVVGGDRLGTRGVVVAHGAPPLPDGVGAAGWLVADALTGDVLAARDPHGRYYPASTLKTLTLLTLAPLLPPDRVVEGTPEDENIEGSRVGIVTGGRYTVDLLFKGLVLQSGNDAANALARAAGGVPVTVAAMNETAERLGAYDTVAGTPSGLDVAGQTSSPYDLALVLRQLVADPVTAAVLTTPTADMPAVGDRPGFQIQNQNPLLGSYPGSLGGKSGFTDAARHTFVAAAERGGRRLVVTVMQTERRPVHEAAQAALLLDWGFSVPAGTDGVGRLVEPGEVGTATPTTPAETAPVTPTAAAPVAETAAGTTSPVWLGAGAAVLAVVAVGTAVTVRRRARTGAGAAAAAATRRPRSAPPRSGSPPPPGPGPAAAEGAPPPEPEPPDRPEPPETPAR
ncbi:D-alanyl-D-alanine carboxypeptidase family protein [Blastococcus sp. SYSU D00669]